MLDLLDDDEAHRKYKGRKSVLDATLLDLCKNHPRHADRRAVHAKLCIIGRSYATGLERAVGSSGALSVLVEHVLENRTRIDRI